MESTAQPVYTADESDSTSNNIVNVTDKHDQFIHLESSEVNGKDVAIQNLEHCEIFLKGIPSSLQIKNLHGCVIIVGPCSKSVEIDECRQCEFAVACQELRVHLSDECDFYVHITAQPIIEDCHHCRFAPYNVEYQSKQNDIVQSGLSWTIDYWDNVLDNNHRTSNVHSPNWETIEEEERKGWSLDLPSAPLIWNC
jgi:protein XRP2